MVDGVMFPMSINVRELEVILQTMKKEAGVEMKDKGREVSEVSLEKSSFDKDVSLL